MFSMLLAVIYLAFISLGLPDSLLGSAWPTMRVHLGVPLSYAGIITMIISSGTIVSSLLSSRLIKKYSAGRITAVSVGMTAAALFGFSLSPTFLALCLFAIPYGLGAGAVDAALNNYVAVHYSSRHMSWLHAFWGVGVSISPYIMSFALSRRLGWQAGYRTVSLIQAALTIVMFLSLRLWGKPENGRESKDGHRVLSLYAAFHIKGVPYVMLSFLSFCAAEATCGLWASSYLADFRGMDAEIAAGFAALFYLGETGGRFLNGFVADRFGDQRMIRAGGILMVAGALMILLPLKSNVPALIGLAALGLGAAPVYPCLIHATPGNFGKENSQSLVGIQMASAYVGSSLMPPLFGLIAQHLSLGLYPYYLLAFAVLMLVMTEKLNGAVAEVWA